MRAGRVCCCCCCCHYLVPILRKPNPVEDLVASVTGWYCGISRDAVVRRAISTGSGQACVGPPQVALIGAGMWGEQVAAGSCRAGRRIKPPRRLCCSWQLAPCRCGACACNDLARGGVAIVMRAWGATGVQRVQDAAGTDGRGAGAWCQMVTGRKGSARQKLCGCAPPPPAKLAGQQSVQPPLHSTTACACLGVR
jgi:hypothetical protein